MGSVVRLPTAAKRKVENHRYAGQRKAVLARRGEWPGEYVHPGWRARRAADAERQAREALALSIERSPELFALLALMTALPSATLRTAVIAAEQMLQLDPLSEGGKTGHALVVTAAERRAAMETLAKFAEDANG